MINPREKIYESAFSLDFAIVAPADTATYINRATTTKFGPMAYTTWRQWAVPLVFILTVYGVASAWYVSQCSAAQPSLRVHSSRTCPASPVAASTSGAAPTWWEVLPASHYGVVIPEPRPLSLLAWLVPDTLAKVPPTWNVTVYHTAATATFLASLLRPWVEGCGRRVTLLQHDEAWKVDTHSIAFINDLLLDARWWLRLPYDKFLLLQTDALICKPHDWDFLELLMKYDYAGAPWAARHRVAAYGTDGPGGNGGFSWRGRAAALEALADTAARLSFAQRGIHNEDVFFSSAVGTLPGRRVAPNNVSCRFSLETDFCALEPPFGLHAAWKYHEGPQWAAIEAACPDVVHVRPLSCMREMIAAAGTSFLVILILSQSHMCMGARGWGTVSLYLYWR